MSDEPLLRLREVMVLSVLTSAGLLTLLLFLTRWRTQWTKVLDWEQRVWHRLGAKPAWTAALRRFEQKRALVFAVAALFVLHFGLFAVAGGAFLYFKPKVEKLRSEHRVLPTSQPPRR